MTTKTTTSTAASNGNGAEEMITMSLTSPEEVAAIIEGAGSPSGYEELPDSAQPPADMDLSNSWLDGYITFSAKWSPRSYRDYHEAMGIWTLSAVAARRVYTHLGKRAYPSMYVLLVSKSGQFSKTGAASISIDLIRDCALDFILAPDQSTPQAFMLSMAGRVPSNYGDLSPERQAKARQSIAFAASRGWFYDEFGTHIAGMMRENGTMADFRGYLKVIDDAPPQFRYATITRGDQIIRRPYLALSGAMTPADMSQHLGKGATLWGDGFMARIATVSPAPNEQGSRARYPKGMKTGQAKLVQRLQEWHQELGIPTVDIVEVTNEETGKVTGYERHDHRMEDTHIKTNAAVYDAYYAYNDALLDMIDNDSGIPQDLRSSYIRFHEKALRMSILLASISGAASIELNHWYRAQQIAETWRNGLHNLYEEAVMSEDKTGRSIGGKILSKIRTKGPMNSRSIQQSIRGLKNAAETKAELTKLCTDGELIQYRLDGKKTDYFRTPGQPETA